MSASLVGSEMCIRDRSPTPRRIPYPLPNPRLARPGSCPPGTSSGRPAGCLLYTSDAADDM
eukprot:12012066-Alexandrium_andersonii.AAC.1